MNKEKRVLSPFQLSNIVVFEAIQYTYTSTVDDTTGIRSEPEVTATSIDFKNCSKGANTEIRGLKIGGTSELSISDKAYCTVPVSG